MIALTASALGGDIECCLAAGMDAHLVKPFSISQLLALIKHWLAAAPLGSAELRQVQVLPAK